MTVPQSDSPRSFHRRPVRQVPVEPGRPVSELMAAMERTGFQGRALARCAAVWERMIRDPECTVLLGYAGSLSTTGQYEMINWLLESGFVDILVGTGANLSEDICDAMGNPYLQADPRDDDANLFKQGLNRYYDVVGHESDYLVMTELIAEYYGTITEEDGAPHTTAELLYGFGQWLNERGIDRSIVATAARNGVPVFCPAIQDSPYGDAALVALSQGNRVRVDAFGDYEQFMRLSEDIQATAVIYLGGGVPKDFVQLFAVTADLLYPDRTIPGRDGGLQRHDDNETYYPHRYAVQITTDSPQWGGLSGCTFDEAVSWGKEDPDGDYAQVYCDATIALPIVTQTLAERLEGFARAKKELALSFAST